MAERPSVKDILAAVRAGGSAQPSAAPAEGGAPEAAAPAAGGSAGAVKLGRPLTLKEKLAAARGELPGAAPAASAPAGEAAPAGEKTVPPPAAPLGRPMTLQEKLAAARGAAPAGGAAPAAKPSAPKAAAAAPKAARELPPLSELTDPKDIAEASRQTGAKKAEEAAPKAAAKAAKPAKAAEVKTVPGRPSRDASLAEEVAATRRAFIRIPWIAAGWVAFTTGAAAFTAMLARFMFPNVLAEPPSTIKVGVPSDFAKGEVNEKWKNEWGFWIVRSEMYNGQDILYALQSVCTHLGCPPNWLAGEQKFKCPCHGSGFYVSGVNFEGPAPRPLERFKIAIGDDGQILVDKSQKFQEELGQWKDPDSYLPAV